MIRSLEKPRVCPRPLLMTPHRSNFKCLVTRPFDCTAPEAFDDCFYLHAQHDLVVKFILLGGSVVPELFRLKQLKRRMKLSWDFFWRRKDSQSGGYLAAASCRSVPKKPRALILLHFPLVRLLCAISLRAILSRIVSLFDYRMNL